MPSATSSFESGALTKIVYLIGLLLVIFSFVGRVPFAIQLFRQMGQNSNVVNPVLAAAMLCSALLVFYFLGWRFIAIVCGKVRLTHLGNGTSQGVLRRFGLLFLTLGVAIQLSVYASLFLVQGGGQIFIANAFNFAVPLGLGLFELSRLSGYETHL